MGHVIWGFLIELDQFSYSLMLKDPPWLTRDLIVMKSETSEFPQYCEVSKYHDLSLLICVSPAPTQSLVMQ